MQNINQMYGTFSADYAKNSAFKGSWFNDFTIL